LILEADICRISVANRLELSMVLERQARPEAARQADAFFSGLPRLSRNR